MHTNRSLLLPYAAPYMVYVCITSVLGDVIPTELNYFLRIVFCTGLLIWAWQWYMDLAGPRSPIISVLTGIPAGVAGLFLWIALLTPFTAGAESAPWSTAGFLLRMIAATLLVPLIEEILIRGYIFRLTYQWWEERKIKGEDPLVTTLDERSVDDIPIGRWSWMAVLVSTLVFMVGHNLNEWPAAAAYGLFMAFLVIIRKDLICCITAHGVTNLSLALYVVGTGNYHLW